MTFKRSSLTLLAAATALISIGAQAEGKISIAQQFGIGYLILDVVRDQNLIEKARQGTGPGYQGGVEQHFRCHRDE